jgi:signal transduction histidine kinase
VSVWIIQYRKSAKTNDILRLKIKKNSQELDVLTEKLAKHTTASQQLTQENEILERGNMVKDRILSIISHDLRSPMSSLQAFLNLFNTNNIARKDLVDFFGKLLSRVENTSTMLENLLHWSQDQLSGIEPKFENVNIQNIVDDSVNLYRMQAEQKHITIDNLTKIASSVYADVEMLKIILRNLISNALKFTDIGGTIFINALREDHQVIVSVKDTGVGISPVNQKQMFAMTNFTTLGTGKEKGTGLGLMLCKDFVEHNQGKIWLESTEGAGTTFYFSIPLSSEEIID